MNSKNSFSPGPTGVLIVGMHRSGTSCLAGMLRQYGLFLGDVSQKSRFNPKGNQESWEVRDIDEQLLNAQGGSWYHPVEVKTIPSLLSLRILRFRRQMENQLKPWGIKDPRLLFCMDAWRLLPDRLVGTFRHPATVKESLVQRNKEKQDPITISDWEALWFQYNRQLVDLYCRQPFPVVDFDWEEQRYQRMVALIAGWLNLPGNNQDFFDPSLIHHRKNSGQQIENPECRALYQQLLVISQQEEEKLGPGGENKKEDI